MFPMTNPMKIAIIDNKSGEFCRKFTCL